MTNRLLKARIIGRFGCQGELARRLGISEDRLSKLIHGRLQPTKDEVKTMARLLGLKASDICGGPGK